jgi:hypothetical protein
VARGRKLHRAQYVISRESRVPGSSIAIRVYHSKLGPFQAEASFLFLAARYDSGSKERGPLARRIRGAVMLALLPFLVSPNSLGVIELVIFLASSIILTIPIFATRGGTQVVWTGIIGFLLTVEVAVMVLLVVLVSRGDIWQ